MPLKRPLLAAFVLICCGIAVFASPLGRYLFHPDGVSTAPSQLCLSYPKGEGHLEVVAMVEVTGGEKNTAMIAPGETLCSAAPATAMAGSIRVGLGEREPPFCRTNARSGDTVVLLRFIPDKNCGWQQ